MMAVGDISALIDSLNNGEDTPQKSCMVRPGWILTVCTGAASVYKLHCRTTSIDSAGQIGTYSDIYNTNLSCWTITDVVKVVDGVAAVFYAKYNDVADAWACAVTTVAVASDGSITGVLDTENIYDEFYAAPHSPPLSSAIPRGRIKLVSTGIFACMYQIDAAYIGVSTFSVAVDGTVTGISNLITTTMAGNFRSDIWRVTGNTWAMIVSTLGAPAQVVLKTFSITVDGYLGAIIDSWQIAATGTTGQSAGIAWYGDIQLIGYVSDDDYIATVRIASNGTITKSLIDSQSGITASAFFKLSDTVVLMEGYYDTYEKISSWTIGTDGTIGSEIDSVATGDRQYLMDAGGGIYTSFKRSYDIPSLGMVLRSYSVTSGYISGIDPISRVTNLVHRYNRLSGEYLLEVHMGEVTDEFGLPKIEWGAKPSSSITEKEQEEADLARRVKDAVDAANPIPIGSLPPEDPYAGTGMYPRTYNLYDVIDKAALPPEDPFAGFKPSPAGEARRVSQEPIGSIGESIWRGEYIKELAGQQAAGSLYKAIGTAVSNVGSAIKGAFSSISNTILGVQSAKEAEASRKNWWNWGP